MFTIYIFINGQGNAFNIGSGNTSRQILDSLRQNRLIPQFQGTFYLQFNGGVLPADEPVGYYGVGPGAQLNVVSQRDVGFGGSGKETLLKAALKAFSSLKKP